jgi:hypothetical protein
MNSADISAATALVAVFVGPIVTLWIARRQIQVSLRQIETSADVANRQIRASVVSNNRQQWINTLRDTIADFIAKQVMVRTRNEKSFANDDSFPRMEEMLRLAYKIQLLINPTEKDHAELVELIFDMANTVSRTSPRPKEFDLNRIVQRVVDLSQAILKREWDRVKCGE